MGAEGGPALQFVSSCVDAQLFTYSPIETLPT